MLLHIIANPRPRGQSRSLRVAEALLAGYRAAHPDAKIIETNLFTVDLPMADAVGVNSRIHQFMGKTLEGEEKQRFEHFMQFIQPLLTCDRLLITTPMWNFNMPWKLKQWLDTVIQARVTFAYTADGPKGLLTCKKAAIVGSRGGKYPADGDPRQTMDFLTTSLKASLAWMGIRDVETCFADGIDADPNRAEQIIGAAERQARSLGEGW